MTKVMIAIAGSAAVLGVALTLARAEHPGDPEPARHAVSGTSLARPIASRSAVSGQLAARAGSVRDVGRFELRDGRQLRLRTFETTAGATCLEDRIGSAGAGASCLEGDPLGSRGAIYSLSFDGGPVRFSQMVVVGLAGPMIRSVALEKTDGTVASVRMNGAGAFVAELAPGELRAGVLPAALLLYGPHGEAVERLSIPAPK